MRRIAGTMLGAAVALAMGACSGGGGGDGGNTATCSPAGTKLSVTAKGFEFDTDCLAAPAGEAFTIDFDNQDAGTPHNVAIDDGQGNKLFTGDVFPGSKSETYQVDALRPGTYEFHCDVHPTMKGSFIVK
jgi:plastocyanin